MITLNLKKIKDFLNLIIGFKLRFHIIKKLRDIIPIIFIDIVRFLKPRKNS